MSVLTEALEKIFNWLQKYDPEPEALHPGFTLQQIQELTQELPFKLPQEVCELYQYYYLEQDLEKSGEIFQKYLAMETI